MLNYMSGCIHWFHSRAEQSALVDMFSISVVWCNGRKLWHVVFVFSFSLLTSLSRVGSIKRSSTVWCREGSCHMWYYAAGAKYIQSNGFSGLNVTHCCLNALGEMETVAMQNKQRPHVHSAHVHTYKNTQIPYFNTKFDISSKCLSYFIY